MLFCKIIQLTSLPQQISDIHFSFQRLQLKLTLRVKTRANSTKPPLNLISDFRSQPRKRNKISTTWMVNLSLYQRRIKMWAAIGFSFSCRAGEICASVFDFMCGGGDDVFQCTYCFGTHRHVLGRLNVLDEDIFISTPRRHQKHHTRYPYFLWSLRLKRGELFGPFNFIQVLISFFSLIIYL